MARRYAVLDVFTATPLEGNPLAVVLDCDGLDGARMQAIAREFGLPETVFVLPAERPAHTARIRIFTPTREMDFAGHPTVGTAALLATQRFGNAAGAFDAMVLLEENVGSVRCAVSLKADGAPYAEFTVPRIAEALAHDLADRGTISDALSLGPADIGFENHHPSAWSCGTPYVFVPVAGLDAMSRACARPAQWNAAFGTDDRIGVFLYTRECVRHHSRFHARMFAPEAGIVEDPATGSAIAAFSGAIHRFDTPPDGAHHYRLEQGFEMGRPSLIDLSLDLAAGKIKAARIGGHAVLIAEGTLLA